MRKGGTPSTTLYPPHYPMEPPHTLSPPHTTTPHPLTYFIMQLHTLANGCARASQIIKAPSVVVDCENISFVTSSRMQYGLAQDGFPIGNGGRGSDHTHMVTPIIIQYYTLSNVLHWVSVHYTDPGTAMWHVTITTQHIT